MSYNYYDAANVSVVKSGGSITEVYIPLYVMSSSSATSGTNTSAYYLAKGAYGVSTKNSSTSLITLSPNWSSSQQFAFEVSIMTGGGTGNAVLYDTTSGTQVANSAITTTSKTFTVVRSSSFTLTPGHAYGVEFYGNGSYATSISKAHLVALSP